MTELPEDYIKTQYSAFMVIRNELPYSVHIDLKSAEKVRDAVNSTQIVPLLSVA